MIVATVGAQLALLLDAASFAVMSAICLSLPPFRPSGQVTPANAAAGRNWLGLGILLRFPAVLVLTICGFGMLFLDGVATVLYPVYSRTFLHVGAAGTACWSRPLGPGPCSAWSRGSACSAACRRRGGSAP